MYSRKVRLATVAGKFYERIPGQLRKNISSYLADTSKNDILPDNAIVQAVIVPHAGYSFSGKTAAKTFSAAARNTNNIPGATNNSKLEREHQPQSEHIASSTKNRPAYKRIIVIAPSHYVAFSGLALPSYEACSTPLGDISVDTKAIDKLSNKNFVRNDNAHTQEHALEVELPFIQTLFPKIPIIPLVCGHVDSDMAKDIAKTLLPFWNSETLWVISSDFTHYGSQFGYVPFTDNVPENLQKLDFGAIEKILDFDLNGFEEYLRKTGATICGRNPIMIMLAVAELAKNRDQLKTKLVEYTTSGELTGDYSHTVSYAGITIYI
jgi:MEMO1 family protein